jgi:hypothetical protein
MFYEFIEQNAGQRPGVSALLLARRRSLWSRAALRRNTERPSPWEPPWEFGRVATSLAIPLPTREERSVRDCIFREETRA